MALGLVLGLGIASSTVASSTAHLRCRGGDLCRGDAGMRGGLDARERDGHVLVEQGEQQHEPRLVRVRVRVSVRLNVRVRVRVSVSVRARVTASSARVGAKARVRARARVRVLVRRRAPPRATPSLAGPQSACPRRRVSPPGYMGLQAAYK